MAENDVPPVREVAVVPVVLLDVLGEFEHAGRGSPSTGDVGGAECFPSVLFGILVVVGFVKPEYVVDSHEHLSGSVGLPRLPRWRRAARAAITMQDLPRLEQQIGRVVRVRWQGSDVLSQIVGGPMRQCQAVGRDLCRRAHPTRVAWTTGPVLAAGRR